MYLTIDNKAKKVESSPKKIGRNCPPPNALCYPPSKCKHPSRAYLTEVFSYRRTLAEAGATISLYPLSRS